MPKKQKWNKGVFISVWDCKQQTDGEGYCLSPIICNTLHGLAFVVSTVLITLYSLPEFIHSTTQRRS